MSSYTTADIRNIALVGHAGSGKTSLVESLLFHAGAIKTMGSVEKGSTVCDFDTLEKKHHHSLISAVASLEHASRHINLIDTPGYPDFMGQALSVLSAVETCAVMINAQSGIETMTRRLMDWAKQRGLCRIIIINKIDVPDAKLPQLLADIRQAFGKECLPINLPANGSTSVADCFFQPSGDSDFSSVEDAHTALIDQTVEVDEGLMALYLEQGDIEPKQLHDPFEQALREGHLVPVCFTSATSGTGIKELLDIFEQLMPNPSEGNPPPYVQGDEADAPVYEVNMDPNRHVLAHVFKVAFDPYVGKIGIFRIHQGTITKDSELFVDQGRKPFKVGHLFAVQGKEHKEMAVGIPGDICAIAKVPSIHFDSMLHNTHEEDDVHLRPVVFPTPLVGLAINPKQRGDEKKLSDVLEKLALEDPCVHVTRDASANETVIRGLGELHLRTLLERMESEYQLSVDSRSPTVPYRETITRKAEGRFRHKKQTGGAGQFAEVYLRIEPTGRGAGFEFLNKVVGGAIPGQFIGPIEKGVRKVIKSGAVAGFPMQDIRVIVYDGRHHNVDSNEVSFSTAGRKAFLDAIGTAKPIVLEPIVHIEITVPNDNMGDVTGDLSSRRGRVNNTQVLSGNLVVVSGMAPLGELEGYQSRLNSMTGGEGSYTIELSHYEPTPAKLQKELISADRAR